MTWSQHDLSGWGGGPLGQWLSGESLDLCRQNEVIPGEAVGCVCPQVDFDAPPPNQQVGMMSLGLSDSSHLVGKLESVGEIDESILLFEVMTAHHPPTAAQLVSEHLRFGVAERRHPALTGNTPLLLEGSALLWHLGD
jgi:hypothetical protein